MLLTDLKSKLETTLDTEIVKVVFDFSTVLNQDLEKEYPYVFWDIDNSKWRKDQRSGIAQIALDVFILSTGSEENADDKFEIWDSLEGQLVVYLEMINTLANIQIGLSDIECEYYPAGLISVDNEYAVRYKVNLKLWC
jgi:hypothetical protein